MGQNERGHGPSYLRRGGGVPGGGVVDGGLLPAGEVAGLEGHRERGGNIPGEDNLQNKDSEFCVLCGLRHSYRYMSLICTL